MSAIPAKTREALARSPRMKRCLVKKGCKGRVTWQHSLRYGGKNLQWWYSIQPLCEQHHFGENGSVTRIGELMSKVAAIEMGLVHLEANYPKRNWLQELAGYKYQLQQYEENLSRNIRTDNHS